MKLNIKSRTGRLALIVATAAAASAVVAMPSSPVSARAIVTPYFALDSTVTCDATRNIVRVTATAGAQPGYYGMAVQIRQYISDGRTAPVWTAWSSWTQLYGPSVTLVNVASNVGDGATMKVYTELRYWTGSAWSVGQGDWATPYMISLANGNPFYNGFCFT